MTLRVNTVFEDLENISKISWDQPGLNVTDKVSAKMNYSNI